MSGQSTINEGGKTLTTGQVSVTSSATHIVGPLAGRIRIVLKNTGAASVFLGKDNTVTTTTGHALAASETLVLLTESDLYGIVASGTCTVTYAEESL